MTICSRTLLWVGVAVAGAFVLAWYALMPSVFGCLPLFAPASRSSECAMHDVKDVFAARGAAAAMDRFAIFASRGLLGSLGECHIFAQEVGDWSYASGADSKSGLGALVPSMRTCDYGYYHAYLEAFFAEHADPHLASSTCSALGQGLEDAPAVRHVCFRSAGSGFMRSRLPDTGAPAMEKAAPEAVLPLQGCADIPGVSVGDLHDCRLGVFGELVYRVTAAHPEELYGFDTLSVLCADSGAGKQECLQQVATAFYIVSD